MTGRTGNRQSLAYVFDPRFPGGTSAALAAELRVAAARQPVLHARRSAMFDGDSVAPALRQSIDDLGLTLIWDAPEIRADTVILHNPSFLKFQNSFGARMLTRRLIVVSHENFLRPGDGESFDVAHCLDLIADATLSLDRCIAPVSGHNRATVRDWLRHHPRQADWQVLDEDWFNICDFPALPPTVAPRDRRGRHSRPGFEKFPQIGAMDFCFPPHAEANVILGADAFLQGGTNRPHWNLHAFRTLDLQSYFGMIDFMVYFTAPTWRESFGRVIAEAIAAGKVVLCDPETGASFGDGIVACTPEEVDDRIAAMVADPALYAAQVARGQARLAALSPAAFAALLDRVIGPETGGAA